MKIYHLKSCDTCKKAIKALADRAPELIDIRADGVPPLTLKSWLATLGPETLINRRSTTWRGLSEADRNEDPLALIFVHPTLIKRPVIELDGKVFCGWTPEVRAALGVS